jgi:hypothetical protein
VGKKHLTGWLFLIGIVLVIFFNLGRWLDITQKPEKMDIIICLGGGDWHRYSKAVALYKKGYARKGLLLLTGEDVTPQMRKSGLPDGRISDLKKHYPNILFSYHPELSSSRDEICFISTFMANRGYNTALVVTDPPHSRRLSILKKVLSSGYEKGVKLSFVSSGVKWWNSETYYTNKTARIYAWTEAVKIPYNLFMLFLTDCEKDI